MTSRNGLVWVYRSLVIVGLVAGGIWSMEFRYAKAADLEAHRRDDRTVAQDLTTEILRNRLDVISAHRFDLEQAGRQRTLSTLERQRLDELRDEEQNLHSRIRHLEGDQP